MHRDAGICLRGVSSSTEDAHNRAAKAINATVDSTAEKSSGTIGPACCQKRSLNTMQCSGSSSGSGGGSSSRPCYSARGHTHCRAPSQAPLLCGARDGGAANRGSRGRCCAMHAGRMAMTIIPSADDDIEASAGGGGFPHDPTVTTLGSNPSCSHGVAGCGGGSGGGAGGGRKPDVVRTAMKPRRRPHKPAAAPGNARGAASSGACAGCSCGWRRCRTCGGRMPTCSPHCCRLETYLDAFQGQGHGAPFCDVRGRRMLRCNAALHRFRRHIPACRC